MRPFQSIHSLLVCPKDKLRLQDACESVHQIPCKKRKKIYIGETGRAAGYDYRNTGKKPHNVIKQAELLGTTTGTLAKSHTT